MHACTQQFVDRSLASVRLCDSFANLDLCVEDGFFLFFGVWIRRIGAIFSLPQLTIDLTDTPTMPDSSRHRSSISLTTAPGTMSSILFTKHVSFEHSVSSPYPVFTSRREEKNNKAKFLSTQSPVIVSPLYPARSARTSRPVLSESAAVSGSEFLCN